VLEKLNFLSLFIHKAEINGLGEGKDVRSLYLN